MTPNEALKKAISLAIANGWDNPEGIIPVTIRGDQVFLVKQYVPRNILFDVKELIFDHGFAKALFGEDKTARNEYELDVDERPAWVVHLQQMVIAEDPIQYLAEHIENDPS